MRKRQFFSFCNRNNCRLKQSKSYLVTNSLESLASVLQTTCQKYYSKYERRILVIKEANKVIQKSAQICLYFYFLCITNSNFIMCFNKRVERLQTGAMKEPKPHKKMRECSWIQNNLLYSLLQVM